MPDKKPFEGELHQKKFIKRLEEGIEEKTRTSTPESPKVSIGVQDTTRGEQPPPVPVEVTLPPESTTETRIEKNYKKEIEDIIRRHVGEDENLGKEYSRLPENIKQDVKSAAPMLRDRINQLLQQEEPDAQEIHNIVLEWLEKFKAQKPFTDQEARNITDEIMELTES